jgi:hypothetical protein
MDMSKDQWLRYVSMLLGFEGGFPVDLLPMAEQLYAQGMSPSGAEKWFIKALRFLETPNVESNRLADNGGNDGDK